MTSHMLTLAAAAWAVPGAVFDRPGARDASRHRRAIMKAARLGCAMSSTVYAPFKR